MREKLKALGLTDEQINSIMEVHNGEISGNFIPKARFDEVNTRATNAETQVKEHAKQLETLKTAAGDNEELKKQIKTLEDENKNKTAEFENKLKESRTDTALQLALAGKVHDATLVLGLLDKSKIVLNDDGSIKSGFTEQFDAIKKEKAFLFVDDTQQSSNPWKPKGVKPPEGSEKTPPPNSAVEMAKAIAGQQTNGNTQGAAAAQYYFGTPAPITQK